MKILLPVFAVVYVLLMTSCFKEKEDGPPQVFTWRMDGGPGQTSDTTNLLSLFGTHTLFGKKGTTSVFLSTNSTNPGTYTKFNASASFGLTIAGTQYGNISGTVTISSSADRRLQGSFYALMIVANVDTIDLTGSFSNIIY